MYRLIPRTEIAEMIHHLRLLHRTLRPRTPEQEMEAERRELFAKNLLSNLHRTGEHPMLSTVLGVADAFSLTLEGAHRVFGYDLEGLRSLDHELNRSRTHVIEDYSFRRDLLIDLPARFGSEEVFERDATLKEIVTRWQQNVPIRTLEETEGWQDDRVFYVHVGTEDSLGSHVPPGSTVLVEPISEAEARRPDTTRTYLLQFNNGYRCSRCVVSGTKLILLRPGMGAPRPREFNFPSAVRIVGRIRFFALPLPAISSASLRSLPESDVSAPLILPWEHTSTADLFAAKNARFRRPRREHPVVRERLESIFRTTLSVRTARRYRRSSPSLPHVDVLMQMTVAHLARYTDTAGLHRRLSDRNRRSLEDLLSVRSLSDLEASPSMAHLPQPASRWTALRGNFVEWPTLFSLAFPRLRPFEDSIVRLAHGATLPGLEPAINPGSFLNLEPAMSPLNFETEAYSFGWGRSIYALRRQGRIFCGHIERAAGKLLLIGGDARGLEQISIDERKLPLLERVTGIAVPL